MKFLGIDFGSGKEGKQLPQITDADRKWMDEIYSWFISTFGHPSPLDKQILVTEEFFPTYFANNDAKALFQDCIELYALEGLEISLNIFEDLRDTSAEEIHVEGFGMDINLEYQKGEDGSPQFIINLSKQLAAHKRRLPSQMALMFSQIYLVLSDPQFMEREDLMLQSNLLAIFQNTSYIIGPELHVADQVGRPFGHSTFVSGSQIPMPVFAYVLALHHYVSDIPFSENLDLLPADLRKEVQVAFNYLQNQGNSLRDEKMIAAFEYDEKAWDAFEKHDYDIAIDLQKRAIEYYKGNLYKARSLNSLGYFLTIDQQPENAMEALLEADRINAYDEHVLGNIAYLLIQQDRLEEADETLEAAFQRPGADIPYLNFCQAIWLHARVEYKEADKLFKELLKEQNQEYPIHLLEYHYALLLEETDQLGEAIQVLENAVTRKEPRAVEMLKRLKTEP